MNYQLIALRENIIVPFKKDMQTVLQQGAVDGFGAMTEILLPECHIDRSLSAKGVIAYNAT